MNRFVCGFGFERSGKLYRRLGVHHVKKVMPFGDYMLRAVRRIGSAPGFRDGHHARLLFWFTLFSEVVHSFFFSVMLFFFIRKAATTGVSDFRLLLINVIVNVLPVMVQRYNRIRICRILRS